MKSTAKLTGAALIDTVMAYCALHNVRVETLAGLTFGEVSFRLAEVCARNPEWVWCSQEIRMGLGEICHEECHVERIQTMMQQWELDGRPGAAPKADNIIPFPTNSTKH